MKTIDRTVVARLAAAFFGTIIVASVLSYLYPVLVSGFDARQYVSSSLHVNWVGWRLVFAVFIVASTVTSVVFITLVVIAFVPLLCVFPRLAHANIYTCLLVGICASLLVLAVSWLVQLLFGLLASGDYFFARVTVILDGPVAMLAFWFTGKQMRNGRRKAT